MIYFLIFISVVQWKFEISKFDYSQIIKFRLFDYKTAKITEIIEILQLSKFDFFAKRYRVFDLELFQNNQVFFEFEFN